MADQAAEPQHGLSVDSLCPEECALHLEPSNLTITSAAERAGKSFGAPPCSFRVRDSERCDSDSDSDAPGAAPEEGQQVLEVLEVAEFKVVKVKASSAAAAPGEMSMSMINNDASDQLTHTHSDVNVNVRTIFIGLPCDNVCLCVCACCLMMAPVTSLLTTFSPAACDFWPSF